MMATRISSSTGDQEAKAEIHDDVEDLSIQN